MTGIIKKEVIPIKSLVTKPLLVDGMLEVKVKWIAIDFSNAFNSSQPKPKSLFCCIT